MARILPPRYGALRTTVSQVSAPRTFPELMARRLRADAGQPLVTAYDDGTGERTELSVTTYANWVSKTANLLTDELGLDAGDTVLLDLPSHWLVPIFLGAAWSSGLSVTETAEVRHAVAICGPETVSNHQAAEHVVACSLRPFAVRFPEPLPDGVLDYGLLWPGQSDVFLGPTLPSPDTVAWMSAGHPRTHADLLETAAVAHLPDAVRLLTDVHPATDAGVPAFLAPVAHNGSMVLLRNATEDSWAARREDERTTAELRASA